MKKILLCGLTESIFIKELSNELTAKNLYVDCLDIGKMVFEKNNYEKNYNYSLSKFSNLNKIGRLLLRFKEIYKLLKNNNYDAINIHAVSTMYLPYIFLMKYFSKKIIITIWGSDYNLATLYEKKIYKIIFLFSDKITFANLQMRDSFLEFYGKGLEKKIYIARFGINSLTTIDKLMLKIDKKNACKLLSLPNDKIIVTCGYSSSRGQQYEKIIDELESLPKNVKDNMYFIFPMTYGDAKYRIEIQNMLNKSTINSRVLSTFLEEKEIAYYRIVSDIMLQLRTTDSFSASMQEYLYTRTIVVYGKWLPYNYFTKKGVEFLPINDLSELRVLLILIKQNLDKYYENTKNNQKVIDGLSSWKITIFDWIHILLDDIKKIDK